MNPYSGKASLAGRTLLMSRSFKSLVELVQRIHLRGGEISMPQASKAVEAMCEDLLLFKSGGNIRLVEPTQLFDKLERGFKRPQETTRRSMRLPLGVKWQDRLNGSGIRWAVSGVSSARHCLLLEESGPIRVYVSDMEAAAQRLGGQEEAVPNFADIDLRQTDDAGAFFDTELDGGIVWASKLQTYLELMSGDARQREAAVALRAQILEEA